METAIETVKDVTQDLINMCNMPANQVKRAMDSNYLSMLVKANPNLNKQHFVEFITKAQLTGADPRLNQIYLIVHDSWNSQTQTKEPKGTTVFSYQFFIRLAQQTGQLEDFDVDISEDTYLDLMTGKRRPSLTARAWVKRKGQGKLNYKARLWEFAKTTKDGVLMGNWKASPYLMLEKCAVTNVMRWAFPEVLGNFYVADEMEKSTGSHTELKPVIETKIEPILIEKSEELIEEFPVEKDLEDYRAELKMDLEKSDIDWVAKIGKDKEYMLAKVEYENDLDKMKSMFDFIKKTILSVVV